MRICFNNGIEKRYENVKYEARFAKALLSRRLKPTYPVLRYSDNVAIEMCKKNMKKVYVVGISNYATDMPKEFSSTQEVEAHYQALRYRDYHKAYFFIATLNKHWVTLEPVEEIEICK